MSYSNPHYILSQIFNITLTNDSIRQRLEVLEGSRQEVETLYRDNIATLNSAIREQLPGVVRLLRLESPPAPLPLYLRLLGSVASLIPRHLGISNSNSTGPSSLTDLQTFILYFGTIQANLERTSETSTEISVDAADAASKAMVQATDCRSMADSARTALVQAQENLRKARSDIASAQLKIAENRRLASAMSGSAGYHDSERDNYETLLAVSGFPIVNLIAVVTVPVALIGMSHHKKKASQCKEIESTSLAQIKTTSSQLPALETTATSATDMVSRLDSAISSCSTSVNTAQGMVQSAKILMDQCAALAVSIADCVDAVNRIAEVACAYGGAGSLTISSDLLDDGAMTAWDVCRYEALEAVHKMLDCLERTEGSSNGCLLEPETLEILEREVKSLKDADLNGSRRLLEDGNRDDDDRHEDDFWDD